jgi:uncharacterized membrane protein YfcA
MPIDPLQIGALAAVAFVGALVFGTTGFGAGLVIIPIATHLVPLQFALPLFALSDLANALRVGFENPRNAVHSEWMLLGPAILIGTALGVTVLVNLPRAAGMVAMGAFVFAFGLHSLLRRRPRLLPRLWAPVAGFVGGATSALFGAGGPAYVMYLSQRGLSKEAFRATLGLCIVTSISLRVAAFLITGLLMDRSVWIAAAVVVPVSFIGVSVAKRIYLRISRETLLRAVFVLLLFSGASLVFRGATF